MQLLVTWSKAPHQAPRDQRQQGEKEIKDEPMACLAWVLPEVYVFPEASVVLILRRPPEGRPLHDKEMPAATDAEQAMPTQGVYLKIKVSDISIRAKMNALRLHLPANCDDEMKSATLTNKIVPSDQYTDLLEGLLPDQLDPLIAQLNDGQRKCVEVHLRKIRNKLCLIKAPKFKKPE